MSKSNLEKEIEADRNAINVFLKMGYSKAMAHDAFVRVYLNESPVQNIDRYNAIRKFIDNFDFQKHFPKSK